MTVETARALGRVMRANTAGFVVGVRVMEPELPNFGALVKARISNGGDVYGLVYDVLVADDLFVRQLIASPRLDSPDAETIIADQRQNRQIPAEVSVLSVAYCRDRQMYYLLPPQPPVALDRVYLCDDEEIKSFTESHDYFRLVLDAAAAPADELLAAALREGARVRGLGGRNFLVQAGRQLISLLANDPVRLDGLLRRIRPVA